MTGLLLKLFADRQLMVESGVVDYLSRRLDRTGTALRAAVEKLDAAALEGHRKISVPFAQKVLTLAQNQPEAEDDQDQHA
jgi:chromosomal replication initiation ATPase DnaA